MAANKGRAKKQAGAQLIKAVLVLMAALAIFVLEKKGVLQTAAGDKPAAENADAAVDFIDVGQGDSTLVCSDGKYMLIDTGDRDGENTLINHLKERGVKKLDYLVLTHPHADHIGEAAEIVEGFKIGKIIMPRVPDDLTPTSSVYEDLLDAAANKGLKIRAARNESFELGEISVQTYAAEGEYSNLNDYSVVLRLTHGENSFLITGDCEKQEESELLERGCDVSADVLKVGHHGSDTSSTSQWLKEVGAQYAVISCGADNKYGHPDEETYSRICKYVKNVYVTAEDGSLAFESDGKGLTVKPFDTADAAKGGK
ncbi:metallo-beta-lactamase domain protein [Ruminococcus sp. CAG:579]|nr:metallo-beta-lactamase domain protein [Ruminococcus sp. CAG:579]